MAAATVTQSNYGRVSAVGTVAAIPIVIAANATTYATATGGLPFDLTQVLIQAAAAQGLELPNIMPTDVVTFVPESLSANGYLPIGFAVVTSGVTYTSTPGYPWGTASGMPTQPGNIQEQVTACPCTIRLVGIGAANTNHSAFGEVADGAVTDTITGLLLIARGGAYN